MHVLSEPQLETRINSSVIVHGTEGRFKSYHSCSFRVAQSTLLISGCTKHKVDKKEKGGTKPSVISATNITWAVDHLPREIIQNLGTSFSMSKRKKQLGTTGKRCVVFKTEQWTQVTGVEEGTDLEVADGEPHDGRLVELFDGLRRHGQLRADVREDLRLLAASTSRRVPRLLLALLCVSAKTQNRRKFTRWRSFVHIGHWSEQRRRWQVSWTGRTAVSAPVHVGHLSWTTKMKPPKSSIQSPQQFSSQSFKQKSTSKQI